MTAAVADCIVRQTPASSGLEAGPGRRGSGTHTTIAQLCVWHCSRGGATSSKHGSRKQLRMWLRQHLCQTTRGACSGGAGGAPADEAGGHVASAAELQQQPLEQKNFFFVAGFSNTVCAAFCALIGLQRAIQAEAG